MSVILCVGENVDFERPFLFAKMHSKFLIFFKFSDPIPTFIKHCFHGIFDPFLPKISEKFTEKIPTFGEGVGVGDASLRMHRLHDVLQFFETSLKNQFS